MAAASGPEDFDVARWPIAEMLDAEPYRFEFFQAVRLLSLMYPGRDVAGRFNNPSEEVVRFGAHTDPSFPASEIQSLDRGQVPAFMRVNFMGLIGPLGMLPLPYTSLVRERLREKDSTLRDFFDIFNHRIISLFCLAFEKYRFSIPYERGERDRFSHHVLALIGLGTPGLQDRQDVADDSLLFYSGLLSLHTRSTVALRQVLMDYFNVPVAIEQFVGVWRPVEPASQCSFSEANDYSERLGFGAIVGDEIWDQQSRVRIRLGPLTMRQYVDFLPGGEAYRGIRALTEFYAGGEYDMELQLVLKRDEVPPCELDPAEGPRLGWTSWVKNAEFRRDPGETILEL
jgi:type VI secretion system protein ImpH